MKTEIVEVGGRQFAAGFVETARRMVAAGEDMRDVSSTVVGETRAELAAAFAAVRAAIGE